MKTQLIFLSTPYSHDDEKIKQKRYKETIAFVAYLLNINLFAFSPVINGLTIAQAHSLPDDWIFWQNYCETFLSKADVVYVLTLTGWEKSTGVKAEIEMAKTLKKKIYYVHPDTYKITEYIPIR